MLLMSVLGRLGDHLGGLEAHNRGNAASGFQMSTPRLGRPFARCRMLASSNFRRV